MHETASMLIAAGLVALTGSVASAADYYVSPGGNDAWSGRLPDPNKDETDGPFATIMKACDAVRQVKKDRPVTVLVRGGTYTLAEPIRFGPEDSGTADAPVTYAAYPGEIPVFNGGRALRGFRREGDLWVTTVAGVAEGKWTFLQFFVNGQRRPRARTPNEGFFKMAGSLPPIPGEPGQKPTPDKTGFRFRPGDITPCKRLGDANIKMIHSWESSIHPIKSIDSEAGVVTFAAPLKEWWGVGHWEPQGRYYVENARELLDQPGEWYLNRETGELTYYPMPGEDPEEADVIAPVVTEFLRFAGDPEAGRPVEHVHVKGLTFRYADWTLSPRGNSDTQAAVSVPAVIMADGALHCSVEDCEVAHVGNYGIWLRHGCKDCSVSGNHLFDLGAGGIRIGETRMAAQDLGETSRSIVHNNYIHDFGEVYAAGVGLWIAQSSHNRISHNHVHDGYYSGISVGWNWSKAPTRTLHNTIEYNHVHHTVRGMLSDGAGIYTLGTQTGTVIRNNVFHDIFPYMGSPTMAWGIYFDQGSNGMLAENNIAYNTLTGGLMNTGQSGNIIRNNIFAHSAWHSVWRWKRDDGPPSTVERNIFYITQGDLFHADGGAADKDTPWDHNLYWRTDSEELLFYDDTLEEWQGRGMDRHSKVADPLFVDAENADFRLKPGSPAADIGFKPIDTSKVGLTPESRWYGKTRQHGKTVLPPSPAHLPPLVISDGFEDTPVGHPPRDARVFVEGRGDSLTVTDKQAAAGNRSLRFVNAPGMEHVWNPHLFYAPRFRRGKALLSFDVRLGEAAVMGHEWRDAKHPFTVGPCLKIGADGTLTANGKQLAQVPRDQWTHIEIICGLGRSAGGTYGLKVDTGGKRLVGRQSLPCGSPKFRTLEWLGFMNLTKGRTAELFIDNIKLDLEKN